MAGPTCNCFLVSRDADGPIRRAVEQIELTALPPGEVLIRSQWSSLNYKDALAASGHPGVAPHLPHVPGIDVAGVVETSDDGRYARGDEVLVTGYELGAPRWGGWSEYVRVPADWVIPLPDALSPRDAMALGTAGFTAAQCVHELERNEITPDSGPVAVSGATGGVGSWAVLMLSRLGYEVHALTGKLAQATRLKQLGAAEVHARDAIMHDKKKPLSSARWAGGIDTVGGEMLVSLLKGTRVNGCISACGLVAGDRLSMTVYPFILRGVRLAGITSSLCPRPMREKIWDHLASLEPLPEDWIAETSLGSLEEALDRISEGNVIGRVLIALGKN